MNRRKALLLSAISAAALYVGNVYADALNNIKQSGAVRIAVLDDYPPWGFAGPGMKTVGFDIEFANLIAKKLGVNVTIVPTTGHNRIPFLQTGKVDMIVACLGKNAEREKAIDFSAPYGEEFNGVFGPASIKAKSPSDFAGKTVGVARGSSEDLVLTRMAPPGTNILRFEDGSGSVQAYYSGQVDLIAIGSTVANNVQRHTSPRKLEFKVMLAEEPTYVGVNKNEPQLLAAVNKIIADAKQDGSLSALSQKWFGVPLSDKLK